MFALWIGMAGLKLSREQMKEFNRIELRAGLSALVLGMLYFVLLVETDRHYLHDSVATVQVFFAGVVILLLYILFHLRYLIAIGIREDLSQKENKEVS